MCYFFSPWDLWNSKNFSLHGVRCCVMNSPVCSHCLCFQCEGFVSNTGYRDSRVFLCSKGQLGRKSTRSIWIWICGQWVYIWTLINNLAGVDCSTNMTEVDGVNVHPCPQYSWLGLVLLALYMMISNVLLLNLLIAMFRFVHTLNK